VNGGRAVELSREFELPAKALDLRVDVWILDPTIESDLTDRCIRESHQVSVEMLLPGGRALFDIPGMQAKRWANPRISASKPSHIFPVIFGGTIHDRFAQAGLRQYLHDGLALSIESSVLQVIVCVVEHDQGGLFWTILI
jgi:hypothetical protein